MFLFGKNNNKELLQYINEGAVLLDVRSTTEFALGSVGNAINIPLHILPFSLEQFKGKKVVVFCLSGARSANALRLLERGGIDTINGKTWRHVRKVINKNGV